VVGKNQTPQAAKSVHTALKGKEQSPSSADQSKMTLVENLRQACESHPKADRGVLGGIEQLGMTVTDVARKQYCPERNRVRGRPEAI